VKTHFFVNKVYALNLDKEMSMQNFYTGNGQFYSPSSVTFTGGSTRTALGNIE
jgi:hypothetical protein